MTSTIGGRMDVATNNGKSVRRGDQSVITEKQSSRKRNNTKRGGVKRRLSSLAYHQQQYMLMRGAHPGGRPLHPSGTNGQRGMPIRYTNVSGPPHLFPPQKFGFFNEATPSIHPGHPGSEKRIYEGPPKPRLMMEEQTRIRQKSMPKPPKLLLTSGRGDIELNGRSIIGPTLEIGSNKSIGPNEQQAGMNELFAKMIWKKLDMIQSPMRLNRLHTEIMNLLQQAIAEETGK
ncbi:Protein kintoun [Dirofilaria immitis]